MSEEHGDDEDREIGKEDEDADVDGTLNVDLSFIFSFPLFAYLASEHKLRRTVWASEFVNSFVYTKINSIKLIIN